MPLCHDTTKHEEAKLVRHIRPPRCCPEITTRTAEEQLHFSVIFSLTTWIDHLNDQGKTFGLCVCRLALLMQLCFYYSISP